MTRSDGQERPLPGRPRRRPPRRWRLPERRGAILVAGIAVAGWLTFVFAGTLGRGDDLETQAQAARQHVLDLEARLELGRSEVEFVASDAFVEQGARALGMGADGELAFHLPEDAPSPAPVPLLGADQDAGSPPNPLESLLRAFTGG